VVLSQTLRSSDAPAQGRNQRDGGNRYSSSGWKHWLQPQRARRDRCWDALDWRCAVLWWEVGIGLTLLPVAAHYWRKGIQSLSLRVL